MKIAIAGKGGVGKTTVCGVMARYLAEEGHRVLTIDADPDANLASALGEIQGVAKKFADTAGSLEKSVAEIEGLGTEFGRLLGREKPETGDGEPGTGEE